jgi:hypothetical protein
VAAATAAITRGMFMFGPSLGMLFDCDSKTSELSEHTASEMKL